MPPQPHPGPYATMLPNANARGRACELGAYIFLANSYTEKENPGDPHPTLMEPMLDQTEVQESAEYGLTWYFRNGNHTVAKALRIPYCYRDEYGLERRDYLLIGFEGGGAH